MISLPSKVKATFMKLKANSSQYIEIKHIKKYFFVYQSTSRWDSERKRPVKVPLYLGRITSKGRFIQAKNRRPRTANQTQHTQTKQQLPVFNPGQRKLEGLPKIEKHYKYEKELLTALSMNGRIAMSVLGRIVGLKETAVSNQVRKLEKRYDIKYMAEIDITKLGYIQFLVTVRFIDKLPTTEKLRELFRNEPRVQLALMTKGDYDLIIHAIAKDSKEISTMVYRLRTKLEYRAIWNAEVAYEVYGYIPLREEFIDLLKGDLLNREYAVLKELTIDGKVDFTEIDRRYRFDKGRSQYSYYRLRERGIIKRITLSMQNLPIRYIALMFEDYIDLKQFKEGRQKELEDLISDSGNQTNRYLLVFEALNPEGGAFYFPVFGDGDLESRVEYRESLNLGVDIKTYIVTSILVGNLCYRSFDNAYSLQEEALVKEHKVKPLQKIDYEETGRIKKERTKYSRDVRGLTPEN